MKKKCVFEIHLWAKFRLKYNNFKLIINTNNNSTIAVYLVSILYFFITWNLLKYIWNSSQTIILTGDIEMNPGMRSHSLPMPFNLSLNFRESLCLLPKLATSESYKYKLFSRNYFSWIKTSRYMFHIYLSLPVSNEI